MEKKYSSEAMMVAHNLAQDLFEVGAISKDEMKEYDRDCLVQAPKTTPNVTPPTANENITPVIV